MQHVHKFKQILLREFYLDTDDLTIRRTNDGYFGRYKKHDEVTYHTDKQGYEKVHIPGTRCSIKRCHLLCVLRQIPLPKRFLIDHINGNVTDDRRQNLRIVNHQINNCNRCMRSDNTSGITGIRWSEPHNHYVIRKTIQGKRISRSRKTLAEAKEVLAQLYTMNHEYTERHGK